jgi:hypothetical protein
MLGRLSWIEQEVDLADGIDDAGRPDARVTACQRRRALAGQARDEPTGDPAVLVVEVLVAHAICDVDNRLRAVAHSAGDAYRIRHRHIFPSCPDGHEVD